MYFNQSENFKKSLSTAQEKKNLEKIFEKYAESTTVLSQRDATIISLKERIKSLMTENKNSKEDKKKLQENLEKVNGELEATQKKIKTHTIPRSTKTKLLTSGASTAARNMTVLDLNKENIEDNDQELSKKAPFKEVVALEAQVFDY